jgi:hypothetical protein
MSRDYKPTKKDAEELARMHNETFPDEPPVTEEEALESLKFVHRRLKEVGFFDK